MKPVSIWSSFLLVVVSGALLAQNPGIKRTVITRKDISVPGREAVVAQVEIAPGASAGRHTHPGEEISYVLEGQADILIEGQPVQQVKAGDAFIIPAGAIHDAHNTGSQPFRLAGVYVVDKSKPMASPVP